MLTITSKTTDVAGTIMHHKLLVLSQNVFGEAEVGTEVVSDDSVSIVTGSL